MDVEVAFRRARERSAELRAMPTPGVDGWAHGLRLAAVYRVVPAPGGVLVHYAWQGVAGSETISDEPIAPGESHDDYHERVKSRRRRIMAELMGAE